MTNSNLIIRKAQPADGEAILALIKALAVFEKLPAPDKDAQRRLLADAFGERPRFEIFLADLTGKVIGYAFIFETYSTFLARPTLYLEDLFVLSEYREQHVGHALFRYCAEEAARRGCGRMEWTVLDWNTNAINFYQRQGASHLNEWLHYRLDETGLTRLLSGSAWPDEIGGSKPG
ncbi:MAG: GNAT family N-acetyltransferase [Aggregatilineales bacterium]